MAVHSFSQLHQALLQFSGEGKRWLFRGHASIKWQLLPKAARANWRVNDLAVLDIWRRRAIQFASSLPESDWDWAAVAQHHGLATRLLDWSLNPLAAAFFALEEDSGDHAVVYAFSANRVIDPRTMPLSDFTGVGEYRPRGVTQRISHQIGVFTVHAPPSLDITVDSQFGPLHAITLDRGGRTNLLRELDFYGINRQSLFPDLDGLSAYVNWFYQDDAKTGTPPYG